MRQIDQVIDAMIAEIPTTEMALIQTFEAVKKASRYHAPEQIPEDWDSLAGFVNAAIPYPPSEDWHKRVVAIFTDRESE